MKPIALTEKAAVLRRCQAVMADIDEGRRRQEGEEARHAESADEGEAEEMPVTQQLREGAEHVADIAADALLGRAGFRQQRGHERDADHRNERYCCEHRAPAERHDQRAAEQRRQNRADREYQHHQRHQPGRLGAGVQIENDGPRDHRHRGSAKALNEAECNQRADAGRQRATDRAQREQHKPGIERRLAAIDVGQRAIDDLAQAEGDEEHRQRQLGRRGRGFQVRRDRRQRGQIHVDRKRSDGGQQAEHDRVAGKGGHADFLRFSAAINVFKRWRTRLPLHTMAGLVPAIHGFDVLATSMPGTRPGTMNQHHIGVTTARTRCSPSRECRTCRCTCRSLSTRRWRHRAS